jgi:CubicO group peptidase (beta-lactamase class C family)
MDIKMRKTYRLATYMTLCFLIICFSNACQFARVVRYNFADINDHKIFPAQVLHPSVQPFYFHQTKTPRHPEVIADGLNDSTDFPTHLKQNDTVAFIISYRDTLHFEEYYLGHRRADVVPSFSIAKSVTSILVGIAWDQGLIESINNSVTKYVPELTNSAFDDITLLHLLQNTSGIKFDENYINPFGQAASFYYGNNLRSQLKKLTTQHPPEYEFKYSSGSSQLLGLVLERVLKNQTLTEYLQEVIWTPVGMEYEGSWSTDWGAPPLEKTFCCLNATAIDYAKIGRLYSHSGKWENQQIVSTSWVNESTKIDSSHGSDKEYQYQWWTIPGSNAFMATGLLGQYIYIDPALDLIIVRLGRSEGGVKDWPLFFQQIADYYKNYE